MSRIERKTHRALHVAARHVVPPVVVVAPQKPSVAAPAAAPTAPTASKANVPRAAALTTVAVAGRDDVKVLLPAQTTWSAYLAALTRTGAFGAQADALAALATVPSRTTAADADRDKPTIGIVLSEADMLLPGHHSTELLIARVRALGCTAVLIPPCADLNLKTPMQRADAIGAMVQALDGVIGPGGADVDPSVYGETNTASVDTNPLRDAFEAAFVRAALDADAYLLGICRSHQLWNAVAGGTLVQDVQLEGRTSISHRHGEHPVRVVRDCLLFEATRQRALTVNSLHHQAVDFAGWGFRVVARAVDPVLPDSAHSVVEATERWNGITVQFHPELLPDVGDALFASVGRRVRVFFELKAFERKGGGNLDAFVARLAAHGVTQHADLTWLKRELRGRFSG